MTPSSPTVTAPKLKITRRGRLAVTALGSLVVALGAVFGSQLSLPSAEASNETSATEFGYILPAYGDTMWSIAERLDPSADPRDLVYEIVLLNQLPDSSLRANEPLAVPLRFVDAPGVVSAADAGISLD